ncbi:MAG: hypothetical protein Q4D63_01950 [Neisseria animaloris]|nr:hypothetical protein [Neisseria animaloris]
MARFKWFSAAVLLAASVSAAPRADSTQIMQQFAGQQGLVFAGSEQDTDGGLWAYRFEPSAACTQNCMPLTVYFSKTQEQCVGEPDLFGEIPLNINGREALFSSPKLTDKLAQASDYITVDAGDGWCYSVSYGTKGSHFKVAQQLASWLVGK